MIHVKKSKIINRINSQSLNSKYLQITKVKNACVEEFGRVDWSQPIFYFIFWKYLACIFLLYYVFIAGPYNFGLVFIVKLVKDKSIYTLPKPYLWSPIVAIVKIKWN